MACCVTVWPVVCQGHSLPRFAQTAAFFSMLHTASQPKGRSCSARRAVRQSRLATLGFAGAIASFQTANTANHMLQIGKQWSDVDDDGTRGKTCILLPIRTIPPCEPYRKTAPPWLVAFIAGYP